MFIGLLGISTNSWIINKLFFIIELTFLKKLMLIRQANQNSAVFVTTGTF